MPELRTERQVEQVVLRACMVQGVYACRACSAPRMTEDSRMWPACRQVGYGPGCSMRTTDVERVLKSLAAAVDMALQGGANIGSGLTRRHAGH